MPVTIHQPSDPPRSRGYNEAASGGGVIAIAGQVAAEDVLAGGGCVRQFGSALARFREVLESAGADPDDVLLLRIYVMDIEAYRASTKELGPAFRETMAGHVPASTLVEVSSLVDERAVVEIEGLAATG